MKDNPEQTAASWLILYDFDGTLTRSDSMIPFVICAVGFGRFLRGLPNVLVRFGRLWRQGRWTRASGKEILLGYFLGGRTRVELGAAEEAFNRVYLPRLLRPHALERLRAWRASGATVAIVSASTDLWLRTFCTREGVALLCTEAEFVDERFTGRLATPNCKYEEKVRRVRAAFVVESFGHIVAYGNSAGDHAMFALAGEAWKCDFFGRFRRYR